MKTTSPLTAALTVGLLMGCVQIGHADPGPARKTAVALPEIVVTATRAPEAPIDLPYTAEMISANDIQNRMQSRTTPEILKETPAVLVQKTGHAQGSPYIRGFTGFRNLFLIDGIRLNNSVFRDGPNQYWGTIDPFSIGRLELVKGPSSVLYGSDAIGGTVNALTLSPFGAKTGRAYYRYSSAEDSHTFRGEGNTVLKDNLGLHAGVTYRSFGDLRSGGGELPHTGYDEHAWDLKAEYLLTPDVRLTLAHQGFKQDDGWRTHKTIYAKPFHGTTVGNERERSFDQRRYLTYAKLDAVEMPGFVEALQITLSHHRQKESMYRIKKDYTSDRKGFDVNTFGASIQAQSTTSIGDWVYGAEWYRDSVDSYSRTYKDDGSLNSIGIQGPVADDSTYDTVGVYVQDTLHLDPRLDLILGGRYNYIKARAGAFEDPQTGERSSLSEHWDALIGSARVLYRLLPEAGVNVFAGVSQGFRAPNLSDLTRFDTARTDEIQSPSPDVDPEYFVSYEVGVKAAGKRFSGEAAYFYTDIQDMITRTPTGRIIDGQHEVTARDSGDGYVHGVELSGSAVLTESWSLWGNFTWMEGEVDTYLTSEPVATREPLSRTVPLTVHAGLHFQPSERYWVEAVMTAADRQDRLSSGDQRDTQRIPPGGTPGYAVFTLRGGVQILDDLVLTLALENIADKDYRVHGSGLNEPGRNAVIAVDYTF